MRLDPFLEEAEKIKEGRFVITSTDRKKIPLGSHRVDDFIIQKLKSCFRDPYSFEYTATPVTHSTNRLGYCPFLIHFSIQYLFLYAKTYLLGSDIAKNLYKRTVKLWRESKKKSRTEVPQRAPSYYPIAKNVHFVVEVEELGVLYYQLSYRSKRNCPMQK